MTRLGPGLERVYRLLSAADLAYGHGTDNAWDEAVQLVLCACDLPADAGREVLDHRVGARQRATIDAWLRARIDERVPLPYLTGRAHFAGLAFRCDARALIPRSPLAEVIVDDYAPWWRGDPPRRLLDLCCGGGAIGIAAAVYRPELTVTLADIDAQALALARDNIALHRVASRVRALASDLFAALRGQRFDVILCNPPYVNREDLASMPAEYAAEPARGLDSGEDGLAHARRILAVARHYLARDGLLFLELGNSWAALDGLLSHLPLTWVELRCGGHGVLVARAPELAAIAAGLAASPNGPRRRPPGGV